VSTPARILLVEDSELVADALHTLLEALGHSVRVAPSVRLAVAACEAEVPDIMLLDLGLPDGHGLEVLEQVKARGALPRVVAAMTGDDDPAMKSRCLAAGCREVLVKPVGARELMARIDVWMRDPAPA
jgi:two-component system KDP operon response regulator KdpE